MAQPPRAARLANRARPPCQCRDLIGPLALPARPPNSGTSRSDGASVLEVELVDVGLVEDEGRPEQDLAAIDHLELAELAHLDLSAPRLQLAIGHRAQHIGC